MAKNATSLRGALVLTVILTGLGALDMAGAIAGLAIAISNGWPHIVLEGQDLRNVYLVLFMCLMGQILARITALPVHAGWALILAKRAHSHQAFPVSVRWAWLGWFVPVVSHWLPCKTLMALNTRLGRAPGKREALIVTAWCARLLTCPTGVVIGFFGTCLTYGFMVAAQRGLALPNMTLLITHWLIIMALLSLVSAALNISVTIMTYRHQPRPDEVRQAEISG